MCANDCLFSYVMEIHKMFLKEKYGGWMRFLFGGFG